MDSGVPAGSGLLTGVAATTSFAGVPVSMRFAQWSAIALAASIPVSTALDNLLLAVLLVSGLLGGWRAIPGTVRHNPVARAALLLFAVLVLWMAYGATPFGEAFSFLGKYVDLAFIPLLMVVMKEEPVRRKAALAFLAVMLATLLLSWGVGLGIVPASEWMWRGCLPDNPAIFRSSITQNVLMAYVVFLLALLAQRASDARMKWLLLVLAILASGSVLFLVQGKTGYLVLFGLLTYLALSALKRRSRKRGRNLHWKEAAGVGLLAVALLFAAYQVSPLMHKRVDLALTEFHAWQPAVHDPTSTGERLGFYYHSLQLIREHFLFGVGTGGFADAYAQLVPGSNVPNPHNEYFLITGQTGLIGLALLLYLFYAQWRHAALLPGPFERNAARGLVMTIAITALFNSPLHDHTEGLFFAFAAALLFSGLPAERGGRHA